jgi:soluble lytic murein transglycosylase-like protein
MSPLSASAGFIASLTACIALPNTASAQIFGTVRPSGMVVLTNIPSAMREADLKVIVASPPNAAASNAATNNAATSNAVVTPIPGPAAPDDSDASRFAEIIAEAGRKWNVRPELLRAVIAVESSFNPLAVSKRGARGLMQLMPETARRFAAGNLFDPRANVLAGARYLRTLLNLFDDDIELALAAYNAGEQSVIKAGYRIPAIPETRAYVPAVMARYRRLISG